MFDTILFVLSLIEEKSVWLDDTSVRAINTTWVTWYTSIRVKT
jgi:hypothetical protein